MERYQKASIQFWHEQDNSTIRSEGAGHAVSNTASTVRSNATVKVYSTRIVMYLYREKNMVLLFGRSKAVIYV